MDAVAKESRSSSQPNDSGCLRTFVGVGLGLALGALVGVIVGLAAGVGIAMILGVL